MWRFSIIILVILLIGLALFVLLGASYPYYVYSRVLDGDFSASWYEAPKRAQKLLKAERLDLEIDIDQSNTLQEFQIGTFVIPLHVNHPERESIIRLDTKAKGQKIDFYDSKKLVSSLYLNDRGAVQLSAGNKFKLFKIPLIKKHLDNLEDDTLWKDVFEKSIDGVKQSYKQMIQNINIIEIRNRTFPANLKKFGQTNIKDTAYVELENGQLLFLKYKDRRVLSYAIEGGLSGWMTGLIRAMRYQASSPYLKDIFYKEFKQLPYQQKISKKGAYLLISAYIQQRDPLVLKEAIHYLQKSDQFKQQLEELIRYSYHRYGKTYALSALDDLELEGEIKLQAKLEIELRSSQEDLRALEVEPPVEGTTKKQRILDRLKIIQER